jgi:hypothetical protein
MKLWIAESWLCTPRLKVRRGKTGSHQLEWVPNIGGVSVYQRNTRECNSEIKECIEQPTRVESTSGSRTRY